MRRYPEIDLENLSPEQRRVRDAIIAGPRGKIEGPLRVWLASPELADRAQRMGAFCRFGTSLERRLSELAILVMAAHWRADFEWNAHAPLALEAGLAPAIIEAIRTGKAPMLDRPDEAAVYSFAHELLTRHRVSDASYAAVTEHLGTHGLVELVGILGYYSLISMTIVTCLPPQARDPFA